MVRLINTQTVSSPDAETCYTVTLTCKSTEEAHLRSLLLHALSQGGLGLRRIDSADIPDTSNVVVTAQVLAAKRNDAALEQIVGRLSLEPHISAVAWEVDRTIPEAWARGSGVRQQATRIQTKLNSWNCGLESGPSLPE